MRFYFYILMLMFFQISFSQVKTREKNPNNELVKAKTEQLIKKYQFFDDFIQRFSSDSAFQKSRIIFPIIYNKINQKDTINKSAWIYKQFYYLTEYESTAIKIFCDSIFSENDSIYNNDTRDIIYIDKDHGLNTYRFNKTNRFWFLTELEYRNLNLNDDFINFLLDISKDSLTQINSINFPVFLRTIDTEADDFPYIDEYINIDKWKYNKVLFKFINTQVPIELYKCNSDYRLFIYYGLDNGIHDEYLFKRINGKWKLIGIYELSL